MEALTKSLQNYIEENRERVEAALREQMPSSLLPAARRLNEALEYALFPGGKRLRPILSLLASDLVGVPREEKFTIACALEFLHSSSLIIDDLPGMDDAATRRDRLALHLVYGEGIAMLAALALLNQSYALLARAARSSGRDGAVESLIEEATRAVGLEGMIGGQAVDIEVRAGCGDAATLAGRDLKTSALMRLMMSAGAIALDSKAEDERALAEFGDCIGRAYQICDDILDDAASCFGTTGKTPAQDARHMRATSVVLLGEAGARSEAERLIERGVARLAERFGERAEVSMLAEAASAVLSRAEARWASA